MTLRAKQMILVFGIRRSGNHLVSDWLIHQYADPRFQALNVQLDFFSFLEDYKTPCGLYNCALFGIEEHPISALDIAYSKHTRKLIKVLLLRDPYNLFASRIKHYKLLDAPYFNSRFASYNWVDYAMYFCDPPPDVICLSYNHFINDPQYRQRIAEMIGVAFDSHQDQKYMNKVDSAVSGGSSFDGKNYDGSGTQMKVSERWAYFKDDEMYKSLFTDEIKALSKKIFDFSPF